MLRHFRPDVAKRSVGLDSDQHGRFSGAAQRRVPCQYWATVLGLGRQTLVMTIPEALSALRRSEAWRTSGDVSRGIVTTDEVDYVWKGVSSSLRLTYCATLSRERIKSGRPRFIMLSDRMEKAMASDTSILTADETKSVGFVQQVSDR